MVVLILGIYLGGMAPAMDCAAQSRRSSPQQIVQAGPAAPNASRVNGELLSLEIIDSSTLKIAPPQTLTRLRVRILSIQTVESMVDALHGQEGQVIDAYSKESVDPHLIGRKITCIVRLRGDERGGRYWVFDLKELLHE